MRTGFALTLVIAMALMSGAHAETPQSAAQDSTAEGPQAEENLGIPPEYLWTNVVTEFDRDRLARLEEAVALGTEESYGASATIRERAAFHKVMDAETKPVNDADLLGWWACRTIKVGGKFSGLVVYSWFDCKVTVRDGFLFFEKRSGSQRLSGRLYQDGPDRRVLLAAPTYNDEPQRAYSGPEGGITNPQRQDKVGVLSQLADGRLKVVFPWSVLESTYDVLELKRPD
ncbi:MAG: DUF4893 domain-containing protein [Rhodobiaceae bacterium]|nr:DUF4893 domain-containing protein [Rhodobiaceae bacterium]